LLKGRERPISISGLGSTAFQQQIIDRLSGNAQCRCQFHNGQTGSANKPFPQYSAGMGGFWGCWFAVIRAHIRVYGYSGVKSLKFSGQPD